MTDPTPLELLDRLDLLVSSLLPLPSSVPPTSAPSPFVQDRLAAQAKELAEVVQLLHKSLNDAGKDVTPYIAKQQEVEKLQREADAQDELLSRVRAQLAGWQERCQKLQQG